MEFDNEHKAIWKKLNQEEARAFLDFLAEEKARHQSEVSELNYTIVKHKDGDDYNRALIELYKSEIIRHEDDVIDIEILIEVVRKWFGEH